MAHTIHERRECYYFGYGANREAAMLHAIIGREPKCIGDAYIDNYELKVQELDQIPAVPRERLRKSWGNDFKSYVIVPNSGGRVYGSIFQVSAHEVSLIDKWELTDVGWYKEQFVEANLIGSDRTIHAATQILPDGQG